MQLYSSAFSSVIISSFLCISGSFAFSDVDSHSLFSESIEYAETNGIISGYSDGSFKPEKEINRAEFIKIIIEANFETNEIYGANCFPDVTNQWFAKYVCTAKRENIVNGYGNGTFGPSYNISFVETAKIIAISNKEEITPQIGTPWYTPYVEKLSEKKAIPNTIAALDKKLVRGEMVEIIWRVKESIKNKPTSVFIDGVMISEPIITTTPIPTPYEEGCLFSDPEEALICAGWNSKCTDTICASPRPQQLFRNKCFAKEAGADNFTFQLNNCPNYTPTPTICPMYDLAEGFCLDGEISSKKDENGCEIPICIVTPEETLQEKVENIAQRENKKICSENTTTQTDFFYSAFPIYQCGNNIGIFSPSGVADAPNKYYDNNGKTFFCGGYQMEGAYQDPRCTDVGECKKTEFYICPINISTPTPYPTPVQNICIMEYAPVCAQPKKTCTDEICTKEMPAPKTYSNLCFMNNSGATLVSEGVCK